MGARAGRDELSPSVKTTPLTTRTRLSAHGSLPVNFPAPPRKSSQHGPPRPSGQGPLPTRNMHRQRRPPRPQGCLRASRRRGPRVCRARLRRPPLPVPAQQRPPVQEHAAPPRPGGHVHGRGLVPQHERICELRTPRETQLTASGSPTTTAPCGALGQRSWGEIIALRTRPHAVSGSAKTGGSAPRRR
jgi:hypothetical protein